jgi:hypothetical protein
MELELMNAFIAGVFAGGLLLGFGFLLGKVSGGGVMHKSVRDDNFDPTDLPMDEGYFEEQWSSEANVVDTVMADETEFPSDNILAELDRLSRHSR